MNNKPIYLDSENASIEIDFNFETVNSLFSDNINFINTMNLKRIIINCPYSKLNNLISVLNKFKNLQVDTFIRVLELEDTKIDDISMIESKYCIIIQKDINCVIETNLNEAFYYEIKFDYADIGQIINLIDANDNIILAPTINVNNLFQCNNILESIFEQAKEKLVLFKSLLLPSELIRKCPYNVYLNNINSNRDYGKNLPRNIYIDEFGSFYPIKLKNEKINMGNLLSNTLEDIIFNIKKTSEYAYFIKINAFVFSRVLTQYPCNFIFWDEYLKDVIENDKTSKYNYYS